MSIDTASPFLADVSNGYIVTPGDWNGQFNSIFDYLNSVVKPAIDDLQAAASGTNVGAQSSFNARLSLTASTPIAADTTGTTLRLCAMNGNVIGIYNTSDLIWERKYLSGDITVGVPATTRELHDIWVGTSGGNLVLSTTDYKKVTALNSPTAGLAKSISLADTGGISVGDVVTISSGSNHEEATVTAVSTNTSITVDWLQFSHTTPSVKTNSPSATYALQDGVVVNNADKSKRLAGTIFTSSSGTVSDTAAIRGISNLYNRVPRSLQATSVTASAAAGTAGAYTVPGGAKGYGTEEVFACVCYRDISFDVFINRGYHKVVSGGIAVDSLVPATTQIAIDTDTGLVFDNFQLRHGGKLGVGRHVIRNVFKDTTGAGQLVFNNSAQFVGMLPQH